MARQSGLIICAWHSKFWEVPMGKVLVFRRKSKRQKRNRYIVVPDNDKIKARALSHGICDPCSRKFMQENISAFREEEIRRMARCIKRR